jgi:hypothetical protein
VGPPSSVPKALITAISLFPAAAMASMKQVLGRVLDEECRPRERAELYNSDSVAR